MEPCSSSHRMFPHQSSWFIADVMKAQFFLHRPDNERVVLLFRCTRGANQVAIRRPRVESLNHCLPLLSCRCTHARGLLQHLHRMR